MTVALVSFLLLAQAAAPKPPPTPPSPQTAQPPPAAPAPAAQPPKVVPPPDPATSSFLGESGLMLVAIKPAATADYELVMRTLHEALWKDTDASRKAATKGWRVFKAGEADAKGNALYIHVLLPAVPAFDYRPSLLIDALVKDLAPELMMRYQDAFAGPPTKLNLTELANMAIEPVAAPEPKKPGGPY